MSNNEAQKGLKAAPERIVLWCGDEPDEMEEMTAEDWVSGDVTWYASGVLTGPEYVRKDIADAAQAEVERLKAELSRTSTETVRHPYKSAIGELASVELERLKAENDNLAVKLAWAESREQNALSRLALRGVTGGEPDA